MFQETEKNTVHHNSLYKEMALSDLTFYMQAIAKKKKVIKCECVQKRLIGVISSVVGFSHKGRLHG